MTTSLEPGFLAIGFAECARRLLADGSIPKTDRERQRLWDLQRSDRRYGFGTVELLVTVASRAEDDVTALGPAEVLRAFVLRSRPVPSLDPCDDAETDAQCDADKAIARVRREPRNPSARHALHQAALRESECARRLADCALVST